MSLITKMGLLLHKAYQRLFQKLDSIRGNPKEVAKGFATGVAMSFTPFVGFHILLSLVVAKITKQNGVAATLGTIAGNPWSFPIIWYLTFHTGIMIMGEGNNSLPANFKEFFVKLFHAIISLDFNLFIHDIWPIFLPMLIGCIPYYILVWYVISYLVEKSIMKPQNNGD
ncbi:MAG: DUF2062 domain-containing protein [Alphaproteobacteria bacterium]|nr:DUF2062 domain-containing protein [Alphaproteobacteria bacterium]